MFKPNDPRFRRRLNEISQTIESANETAQTRVFVFGQQYVRPCLSSLGNFIQPCTQCCYSTRDQRLRRPRANARGRAESNFDFYDDWEEDETDGLLGWSDEEYDSFLTGPVSYGGVSSQQPSRQRAMSYGTRRGAKAAIPDSETAIPSAPSYLGFFGKFAGLAKSRNLRYKPSAAGLQEHPGASKKHNAGEESEPLMTDESDGDIDPQRLRRARRGRSNTVGSQETQDSFSSRGDLFPSDDEADAVPLDDEFAMVLERRTTATSGHDDSSSGITSDKRPGSLSRRSTTRTTASSRSAGAGGRRSKRSSLARTTTSDTRRSLEVIPPEADAAAIEAVPTLNELKQEEEQARLEEESAVEQRREAAQVLAASKGLTAVGDSNVDSDEAVDLEASQELQPSSGASLQSHTSTSNFSSAAGAESISPALEDDEQVEPSKSRNGTGDAE